MSDKDESQSLKFEDNEAKELAEQNPQGSDKRSSKQGESVPAEGGGGGDAGAGTAGTPGEGSGIRGGSQGDAGGASYGGGTGNA